MWDKYAVGCEDDSGDDDDWYEQSDFVEDAVIAIMLAGTSTSQLLGQNVPPEGKKTPSPVSALQKLVPSGVPTGAINVPSDIVCRFREFNAVYEDVRHFGEVKYETINQITEDRLCEWMTTAQYVWRFVLQIQKEDVSHGFERVFRFREI